MARKFTPEWWAEQRPEVVGKATEKLVEDVFDELNKSMGFAYHRLPDAKAARGALAAQPADYVYFFRGVGGFIEVKALKHVLRLPRDRVTQLPVLHKFDFAGSRNFVIVHHYMTGKWRTISTADLRHGVPSWDLRGVPEHDTPYQAVATALCMITNEKLKQQQGR
jgi:hypothetical protein